MKEFKHRLSLVMIAYNEESRIERVLREYHDGVFRLMPPGSEYIVFLDGPTDGTADIVKSLAPELGIRVVHSEQNRGYFMAAKSALAHAANEVVFFSDSSGKHRAEDFWRMAPLIDDFDIVTGLRSGRGDSPYRQLLSAMQRIFVSLLFMMPLFDYNSGFKLIHKEVLDTTLAECGTLPVTFSTELVIRAYRHGFRIVNCPVSFAHRDGGERQFAPKRLPAILAGQLVGFIKLRVGSP